MCIHCMVPVTMLRSNSGMSWDFHHDRTKFFISHVWSPLRIFYVQLLFLEPKSRCYQLLHRWQHIPFLCQKHLPSLQLTCADQNHRELLSVGMDNTHLIAVAWKTAKCGMAFSAHGDEFTAWLEGGLPNGNLFYVRTIKSHSRNKFMEGYKVIFEHWEHRRGVS